MKSAEYRDIGRGRRSGVAAALVFALVMLLLMVATPARAAEKPFKIEFDRSDLKIGALGDLGGIDQLPLGAGREGGSIDGIWDPATGRVTVPKGKFVLPEIGIDDPVKLRLFMGIEAPATGTFDPDTGALELDSKAGIWIKVDAAALLDLLGLDVGDLLGGLGGGSGGGGLGGVAGNLIRSQLSNLTCGFSPMDVSFTTGSNSLATGTPFLKGPQGTGAITAEWSRLGPFAGRSKLPIINLDPCLLIRDMLPGLLEGGAGGALPGGIDLGGLDLGGLLDGISDLDLGPSSITLTRTIDQSSVPGPPKPRAKRTRLKIRAVARGTRVGTADRARFRVAVKNTGRVPARKARLCMTGYAIRRNCVRLGKIKAGGSKKRVFAARVNVKRLFGRSQHVLRPRFTVRAKNAPRVRTRKARVRVMRPW